ncbi:MAG: hypothetical protein JO256_10495 [Alphaproteobacteria bacterium]|nr:hypothetical protein [Alphaproteobacteria bacterium]
MMVLALLAPMMAAKGQTLEPLTLPLGNAELSVGGAARAALFRADQPGSAADIAGVAKLIARLQQTDDTGLTLSLNTTLAVHDRLSFGRYDGDLLEKLYGEARTGLGVVRLGLVDGASAALAVAGPVADTAVSLNDPSVTFFRDKNGNAIANIFTLRTPGGPSSNYAKLVYESPDLSSLLGMGVRLSLSFAPSEGKNVLPFLAAGPKVAGRQADMWEGALRYDSDFGPLSVSAYGGASFGRGEHKLPGQEGVSDYAAGLRGDYAVNQTLTLSLGAAFHSSNAYGFDINRAYDGAATRIVHVSGGATYYGWSASLEYGSGVAGGVAGNARLGLNGTEAQIAHSFSDSVLASVGWQHLIYNRDKGSFYDGSRRLSLDALFVHLSLRTRPI